MNFLKLLYSDRSINQLQSIVVSLSFVLSGFGSYTSSANCDAKELLVRAHGAIESGAIDGTVLTHDNRTRFLNAVFAECPVLKAKLTHSKLRDLLESVTDGWQVGTVSWSQSLKDHYYQLKEAVLISNFSEIGDIVFAAKENPDGLCDSKEIVSRFMSIGDCLTPRTGHPEKGGFFLHVCVSSVVDRLASYVHFTDLCPQVNLASEDLREVVLASKVDAGMSQKFATIEASSYILKSLRDPFSIQFMDDLIDVVDRSWKQWVGRK